MRKNVFGRQFKRDKNERKALFKNLMSSLILNDRIQTTEEKAKSIRAQVERLVTKAKKGGVYIPRLLERDLHHPAIDKLINNVAPRFKERKGGYTRIIKLGNRLADNARMALIEWVEQDISNINLPVGGQKSKTVEPEETKSVKGIKSIKGKTERRENKKEEKTAQTDKQEKKRGKK